MFIRYTVMIFGEKFTPTQIDGLQLENMRISDISDFPKNSTVVYVSAIPVNLPHI